MKATMTCHCGARIEIDTDSWELAVKAADDFAERHKECKNEIPRGIAKYGLAPHTGGEKGRFDMTKNAKRAEPSKALLASVDSVLQWFREKARNEDRRSDAQHYADTQWLIRHDMKANAEHHARPERT